MQKLIRNKVINYKAWYELEKNLRRHPDESRDPVFFTRENLSIYKRNIRLLADWIPSFDGMTIGAGFS